MYVVFDLRLPVVRNTGSAREFMTKKVLNSLICSFESNRCYSDIKKLVKDIILIRLDMKAKNEGLPENNKMNIKAHRKKICFVLKYFI